MRSPVWGLKRLRCTQGWVRSFRIFWANAKMWIGSWPCGYRKKIVAVWSPAIHDRLSAFLDAAASKNCPNQICSSCSGTLAAYQNRQWNKSYQQDITIKRKEPLSLFDSNYSGVLLVIGMATPQVNGLIAGHVGSQPWHSGVSCRLYI